MLWINYKFVKQSVSTITLERHESYTTQKANLYKVADVISFSESLYCIYTGRKQGK